MIKRYKPSKRFFWVVRLNLVVLKDIATIESTFGLFGYGVLIQWRYKSFIAPPQESQEKQDAL